MAWAIFHLFSACLEVTWPWPASHLGAFEGWVARPCDALPGPPATVRPPSGGDNIIHMQNLIGIMDLRRWASPIPSSRGLGSALSLHWRGAFSPHSGANHTGNYCIQRTSRGGGVGGGGGVRDVQGLMGGN